ncbi:MAG: hypothetical protein PVJ25_07450 [Desulfuromonadales bacterium]
MKTLAQTFLYKGRSMWPCFQEGDLLVLEEIDFRRIRIGDCIAYLSGSGNQAVHRVVALQGSLITRGDAMPCIDSAMVKPEQVAGRVVACYRFGRRRKIYHGVFGRIAGLLYRYAGRIDPQRAARGGCLARRIRSFSMAALKTVRCQGKPEKLKLPGTDEVSVWTIGGRVIGQQDRNSKQWQIAWPWKVFFAIDEDS